MKGMRMAKEMPGGGKLPKEMPHGGKVPGAIKRAAKKTAKGRANIMKGLSMLGKVGDDRGTVDAKADFGFVSKDDVRKTKKAARTMKRGVRQKQAGARKKARYEFRQELKSGGKKMPGGGKMHMKMPGGGKMPMYMAGGKVYKDGGSLMAALLKDPKQRARAKKIMGM